MIDVASRIHGNLGIFDDPLEEELYESYKDAVEAGSGEAMEAWRKAWAKRYDDRQELIESPNSAIRLYVAEVEQPDDLEDLYYDPDRWVKKDVDRICSRALATDFVQVMEKANKAYHDLTTEKAGVEEDIKRIKEDIMSYPQTDELKRVDALEKALHDYVTELEAVNHSAHLACLAVQHGHSIDDEQKDALYQIMGRLRTMLNEKVQAETSICKLQRIYAQELGNLDQVFRKIQKMEGDEDDR